MLINRTLAVAMSACLVSGSLSAWAQPVQKVHRIGVLGVASPTTYARQVEALRQGLRDLGYVEGKNTIVEFRWAEGNIARLPELAAELIRLNPDVLVTSGPGTVVAKRATTTIPIVMAVSVNAVENGLVESLARPGENVTGSTSFGRELSVKRLEWLREVFPRLHSVGVLVHTGDAASAGTLQGMEDAARLLKLPLQVVRASSAADLERIFTPLANARVEGLVVTDHTMFVAEAARISRLATTHRLPVIGSVEIADSGGLLAYGVDFPELWRRAATFVDKILKGAKPGDLPIERPTKFQYVVNLKAAQALGVTIPYAIRLRADRVVE